MNPHQPNCAIHTPDFAREMKAGFWLARENPGILNYIPAHQLLNIAAQRAVEVVPVPVTAPPDELCPLEVTSTTATLETSPSPEPIIV